MQRCTGALLLTSMIKHSGDETCREEWPGLAHCVAIRIFLSLLCHTSSELSDAAMEEMVHHTCTGSSLL